MPVTTNPQAYLSDIGGANSKVWLSVWQSNLYQQDGLNPDAAAFGGVGGAAAGHMGGYQEAWVDSQSTQRAPRSHYARLYPAEHWTPQWDTISPNWETVDVGGVNGIKLRHNPQPDAPRQTLVYGRLRGDKGMNDIPDLCVPDQVGIAYPSGGEYITVDDVGPSIPGGGGGGAAAANAPAFYDPGIDGTLGMPGPPEVKTQSLLSDVPFKPSSVDFIADSGAKAKGYKDIIAAKGIKLWNIWDMVYPTPSLDGRRYLANRGPIWGTTSYGGPVAEQVGSVGNLRVRLTSNRGTATMRRIYPIEKDIGRDGTYPWIFPFVGPGHGAAIPSGAINHEIQKEGTSAERLIDHDDGSELDHGTSPANLGFVINMDVTAEAQRGFFGGAGGGSSNIKVTWGGVGSGGNMATASARWAIGFEAVISPNKVPFLHYHDGVKVSKIYLAEAPIGPTIGSLKLRVEYHGPSMYVWLGDGGMPICVRGYNSWSGGGERWGVWVKSNDVQFTATNCTVVFDFMPIYYDPWSPTQQIDFQSGNVESGVSRVDEFYTLPNGPSFENGMAAILNLGQFHLPTGTGQTEVTRFMRYLQDSMLRQSPTLNDMCGPTGQGMWEWNQPSVVPSAPFWHQDEGWPVMLRDSRQVSCLTGTADALPFRCWDPTSDVQYLTSHAIRTGTGQPTMLNTDTTTINVLFRANVTHTTPFVLGFKADDAVAPLAHGGSSHSEPLKPVSWQIDWKSEEGNVGCLMTASARIVLANPSADVILALANNQMRVRITETGYPQWASALEARGGNTKLLQAVKCDVPIFDGVTVGLSVNRTSGGKVLVTIEAVDPMFMLERAMIETNLRFDGCNYLTAFCLLFRHSDYSSSMMVRLSEGGGLSALPGRNSRFVGNGWTGTFRADQLFPELVTSHYFGYSPTTGRSYEVPAGTMLMSALRGILRYMSTPNFVPLFYYDPTSAMFVLTKRGLDDSKGLWPGNTAGGAGAYTHPWIFDSPAMISAAGFDASSLAAGLMMQAEKGESLYTLESSTKYLASHYMAYGTNRATGVPLKATSVNPMWNGLKGTTTLAEWAAVYGHMGYRAKVKDEQPNFISDMRAAWRYCDDQMWWLMRPVLKLSNITVDGMIFPGGELGGLVDGTVGIVTGNELFQNAFLDTASIRFDAEDERVKSTISCYVFPRV